MKPPRLAEWLLTDTAAPGLLNDSLAEEFTRANPSLGIGTR